MACLPLRRGCIKLTIHQRQTSLLTLPLLPRDCLSTRKYWPAQRKRAEQQQHITRKHYQLILVGRANLGNMPG